MVLDNRRLEKLGVQLVVGCTKQCLASRGLNGVPAPLSSGGVLEKGGRRVFS